MADSRTGWIVVDAVFPRERLDARVFREVRFRLVLNVVVDGEHRLPGVVNRAGADGQELGNDGAGVVVRHHVLGPDGDVVPRMHRFSLGQPDRVTVGDLLDHRLSHPASVVIKNQGRRPTGRGA